MCYLGILLTILFMAFLYRYIISGGVMHMDIPAIDIYHKDTFKNFQKILMDLLKVQVNSFFSFFDDQLRAF